MGDLSNQAKAIFLEALEGPAPEQWPAFLEQACAGDAELRAEVERLLRARAELGSFHEAPASTLFAPAEEAIREVPGSAVGPYKLLEQIGEGGFGVVFMAEQQQPIRRKVALKVLKPGMDSKQVIARFEAERQALALMDHPNIARVLDAGQTDSGRPYFVMELVKGILVTEYCDEGRLTPRERLCLFVDVCRAVQHAHQKGVIHRDIKPSNVLVTLQDGVPLVKVIDFGIAKALGRQLTDRTLFTGFAQMIGTPLYMSPEQAALSNVDVDTRSDVYSLGVLLYELLTGTTPFDRERLHQAGYDEMRRIIREEDPPRPSTRIPTLGQAATTVSTQRKSHPKRLSQLYRGDLDWVVMKALEKDRNRRYESASAFAADVQHYLADEPVQACPPSAGYRLRKFARRNRGRLTAAAVLGVALLAVVGAMAGSIGWAVRNREARLARLTGQVETILEETARLEQEQKWPEALATVERAEAVAGDEASDALRQHIAAVRRDLEFIAELERIREERAGDVEGKFNHAGAVRHYAEAFRAYGVDIEARPAEETSARLQGKSALAVAIAAALDDWADARRELGEGEPSWKPLVAVARGLDHDPLRDRLRATWGQPFTPEGEAELRRLAESIDVKAQLPGTLQFLARTLNRARLADVALRILQDGQQAYPADFWLNFDLQNLLYARKDYTGALRYCSAAVSLRPGSANAHISLGLALQWQLQNPNGKDKALAEFRRAAAIDPKNALGYVGLSNVLRDQGKLEEAIAGYGKAIEIDPKLIWAHINLGVALEKQGKLDVAVTCYQTATGLDPRNTEAQNNLFNACVRLGRWGEALALIDKTMELAPNDHWYPFLAAALHLQTGDLGDYRRICREMLERFGDTKDPGVAEHVAKTCLLMPDAVADRDRVLKLARWAVTQNSNDRWFLLCVALAEYRAGRSAEALQWLERFAPKAAYGWPSEGSALAVLALVQLHQGRHEEALAALDQAEMVATKMPDPTGGRPFGNDWYDWLHCQALLGEAEKVIKPDEAQIHFYRAGRRGGQEKWSEAEAEYREAIRLRPNWYEAHYQMAVAIWEQGRQKDAQAAFREALRRAPKPPIGPPRATFATPWSDTDQWVVKGQEVHQLDEKRGHIMLFGNPDWIDYDFEAEVEIIAGGSEVGLIFRATDRDDYLYAVIGGWSNTGHAILIAHKGAVGIGFVKGQSKKGCWYRLRVEVHRERVKMFLDDKFLMTIDAGERLRGCVGLVTNPVHARFRNLKVTDATGKVLWEGVQDVLPKK